jgi:hypothetical protein
MSAVSDEISHVAKNLEVGYGNSKYKAVSEADVLNAVKPLEVKHGIYSYPSERTPILMEFVEKPGKDGAARIETFIRIKTTYVFVNVDDPADRITIDTFGDGVDAQDKAPGKAMTYADKYALLKAYKIQTGEDPDANASQEMNRVRPQSPASRNRGIITEEQAAELQLLVDKSGIDADKFLAYYKTKSLDTFPSSSFNEAIRTLNKRMSDNAPVETVRPLEALGKEVEQLEG